MKNDKLEVGLNSTYLQIVVRDLSLVDVSDLESHGRLLYYLLFEHLSIFDGVSGRTEWSSGSLPLLPSWVWPRSFGRLVLKPSSRWLLSSERVWVSLIVSGWSVALEILHNEWRFSQMFKGWSKYQCLLNLLSPGPLFVTSLEANKKFPESKPYQVSKFLETARSKIYVIHHSSSLIKISLINIFNDK